MEAIIRDGENVSARSDLASLGIFAGVRQRSFMSCDILRELGNTWGHGSPRGDRLPVESRGKGNGVRWLIHP